MNRARVRHLEREYAQRMRPKAEVIVHHRHKDGVCNPPLPEVEDGHLHVIINYVELDINGKLPRAAYGPVDCW